MARPVRIQVKASVIRSIRYYARVKKNQVIEYFQATSRKKFGIDIGYLELIESTDEDIDFSLIKEFAKLYKFPIACFFLPKPLKDDLVPPDYRKAPSGSVRDISSKMALILRHARRAQYVVGYLDQVSPLKLPRISLKNNVEEMASQARALLPHAFRVQSRSKNPYDLFTELRKELGEKGIIVMKASFPLDDARAFSLTEKKPYVIVINNKDGTEYGYTPKIFSLLHEFCHLLLRDGGLCNDFSSSNSIAIELFCNAFAGACLIPRDDFLNKIRERDFVNKNFSRRIEIIDYFRKVYLVGGEVVIRRLNSLGALSRAEMDKLIVRWDNYAERYRKKSYIPRLTQPQKYLNLNGNYYSGLLISTVAQGGMTPETAVSCLGIKLKHFNAMKDLVLSRNNER